MLLTIFITQLVVLGAGLFLRVYLTQKAKNIATKEDVSALTRQVETVKSEFRVQEELLRASLGHRVAIQRARFELELQSYQDLWKQFLELEAALLKLQSLCLTRADSAGFIPDAYQEFTRLRERLTNSVEQIEPFIDASIHESVSRSALTLRAVAGDALFSMAHTDEERDAFIKRWIDAASEARRNLARALGNRLFGDDALALPPTH
jgi:hypothetical protein